MWEAIATVLTSDNAPAVLWGVIAIVILAVVLVSRGVIRVHTDSISIGDENKYQFYERKIIQEQCSFTHTYLMGLMPRLRRISPDGTLLYDGWLATAVLEKVYDEFVQWITFNHISTEEAYVHMKQQKLCMLVYCHPLRKEFQTKEFRQQMCDWVTDIITELVRIRKVYTSEMSKRRK